jgi:hypothetical protein
VAARAVEAVRVTNLSNDAESPRSKTQSHDANVLFGLRPWTLSLELGRFS